MTIRIDPGRGCRDGWQGWHGWHALSDERSEGRGARPGALATLRTLERKRAGFSENRISRGERLETLPTPIVVPPLGVPPFCRVALLLLLAFNSLAGSTRADEALRSVGIARVDITPDYPVRLHGFGFRREESSGVRQSIWAKALAIGTDDEGPALVITTDNLGVPDAMVTELGKRLEQEVGLDPARLAVTATHTHSAPMLAGVAPTIFEQPSPAHLDHIRRYTREFADKLHEVALAALKDRRPATLWLGVGRAGFSVNRRTKGGPVDHDVPILAVRAPDGALRAVYVNYACHCVTLSDNRISGDWAGYAQEHIERQHRGVTALFSVGCGADSNPSSGVTGDKEDIASQQGAEIAAVVNRLLEGPLRPVEGPLVAKLKRIELKLAPLPSKDEFLERAKRGDAIGNHARVQLARLDRGEPLATEISYPVQTWSFGDSLALVFLPGEVVVDYSLRLKRELDGQRLWINAYANASPCYIPSERVLKEGGYEGGDAMTYYDLPARLAPGLEQAIVDAVHRQLDERFPGMPETPDPSKPLTQEQSLAAIRTKPGMTVDLVAAEPLVASPVAIDFGPDGRLWVAEMYDYPEGIGPEGVPGGRIRMLESTKNDGQFDKASVFVNGIPFPTGVTVWRKGILICAAPDILYAEDKDGDGRADVVRKLFSGFGTGNYQARVNSLEYGLDGWVYGSCGIFGGQITSFNGKTYPLGDRDFRIRPDTGEIEPAAGRTQQGRVHDDWMNWFGCNNSVLCFHYPLPDHYLRRNPFFTAASTTQFVPATNADSQLFPLNPGLQLFRLSGPSGQPTAACGIGAYRDSLLGDDYRGDVFTCEPVNLLVHRLRLSPAGGTFAGRRADDEKNSEFLASSDPWFRPVQARTGPDGCLWIVDMHRYVIEHPRWIPPEELSQVDVRAGQDMGRIYRVRPAGTAPRPWVKLDSLNTADLAAALDTPNGWQRDMAANCLLWRSDRDCLPTLRALAVKTGRAETRFAALSVLDGFGALSARDIRTALGDKHAGVRRHAIRLSERFLETNRELGADLLPLVNDDDGQVRLQLAATLGQWKDRRAAAPLAALALQADDQYQTSLVLSSLRRDNAIDILAALLASTPDAPGREELLASLVGMAAALSDQKELPRLFDLALPPDAGSVAPWRWNVAARLLESLVRRDAGLTLTTAGAARNRLTHLLDEARKTLAATETPDATRLAALSVLGRLPDQFAADRSALVDLISPQQPQAIQQGAAAAFGRIPGRESAEALVSNWRGQSPALKGRVLDLLLGRAEGLEVLLEQMAAGGIAPREIDATRRQQLLHHRDPAIRAAAEKLLVGTENADRRKVIDHYRKAAETSGDRTRGKAVFARVCSTCHRLDGTGFGVGPDLAAVAAKSPQALLQEILDPNRNVDSRYTIYTAATKAGRTFSGLLAAETATSITLVGQEARQEVLLRADLDELQGSNQSLMPEGLEKDLSLQDASDLLAYLAAHGPAPKAFEGNRPETLVLRDGTLPLLATNGAIYGDAIAFEAPFRNIGFWHGMHDFVVWNVELAEPASFDVWLDWACDSASSGNAFVFNGGTPPLRGTVDSTGGWDQYRQQKVGTVQIDAGAHRLTLQPEGTSLHGALMDLRAVYLVPPGSRPNLALAEAPAPDVGDVATIAAQVLDDNLPSPQREVLIRAKVTQAPELIEKMTADLKPGTPEEYRRIPWIWRVSIAAGKQNDAKVLQGVLAISLPKDGEVLHDWQAVVIGGGVINGISQLPVWPRERVAEILRGNEGLEKRWGRLLDQAAEMAENEKVPTGTRYDALRIIPLDDWEKRGEQIKKYLLKGVHDELQLGAISGISDVDNPVAADLLLRNFNGFSEENRHIALDALLRTEPRCIALLDALGKKAIAAAALSEKQRQALRSHSSAAIRERAEHVLGAE